MATPRNWDLLAPGTRRRWVAALGGHRFLPADTRAQRARSAYERGASLTPAQRGHEPPEVRRARSITAYIGPQAQVVQLSGLTRAELSRVARHDALIGQLAANRITPREFQRRVSRWAPVAGRQLSSDPYAVLAAREALRAADQPTFEYRSGRAA